MSGKKLLAAEVSKFRRGKLLAAESFQIRSIINYSQHLNFLPNEIAVSQKVFSGEVG